MIDIEKELSEMTIMCATANAKILTLIDELKDCEQDVFCVEILNRLIEIQRVFIRKYE